MEFKGLRGPDANVFTTCYFKYGKFEGCFPAFGGSLYGVWIEEVRNKTSTAGN